MFNDERISTIQIKLYKGALLLSILASILVFLLRIISKTSLLAGSTEIIIIIVGIGILIYNKINYQSLEDERSEFNNLRNWQKYFKIFLYSFIVGLSLSLSFTITSNGEVIPPSMIITRLAPLLLLYFGYNLKKHQIFFNYHIIEQDNKSFYINVLKAILNIIKVVAIIYILPLFIVIILNISSSYLINYILSILLAFLLTILSLAFSYFLISMLDKIYYNHINSDNKINWVKTSLIILCVTLILISSFLSLYTQFYSSQLKPEKINLISTVINQISPVITSIFILLISYTASYIDQANKKLLSFTLLFLLMNFVSIILPLLNQILTLIITLKTNISPNETLAFKMFDVLNYLNISLLIISLFISIFSLIKRYKFNKLILIIPFSFMFILVISLLIRFNVIPSNNFFMIITALLNFILLINILLFNSKKISNPKSLT